MMVSTPIFAAGMVLYGWSAQYHVHWIVLNLGAALFAVGLMGIFLSIQNYLVDFAGLLAASAICESSP